MNLAGVRSAPSKATRYKLEDLHFFYTKHFMLFCRLFCAEFVKAEDCFRLGNRLITR